MEPYLETRWLRRCVLAGLVWLIGARLLPAQDTLARPGSSQVVGSDSAKLSLSREKVDVNAVARDDEIGRRLQSVLIAT
ncbi:MAG TPA: hypothetical protein VIP11_23475, partial [Gemmatimonadaceae bacterium]